MTSFVLASLTGALLGFLMAFLSVFLILLILIQRGKGGGLTGALGGPGGQSAFGSKAGDTFTVITIVVASIWGFTCAFTMWLLGTHAPTAVTETNVSAGPGDDEGIETPPIIPPASGTGIGGFGGLSSGDDPAAPTIGTPSVELTPADGATTETDADSETPPSDSGGESAEENAGEGETEAADAETPESDAADSDASDDDSESDGDQE